MEDANLIWTEQPVLDNPLLILGFSGWSNGGEVPSSVLWYILSRFDAKIIAELKTDGFYTYNVGRADAKRPLVEIENGMIRAFSAQTLNFWAHKAELGGKDMLLVSGPEPELNWNSLTKTIINVAKFYDVEKIITLGGMFDSIPHTAPPRIQGVANYSTLVDELKEYHIEPVNYKGPSSIYGQVLVEATKNDIPAVSLWASTPHYIQVTNFIACYHLMLKLNELYGLNIDLEVASQDSKYLYKQIDDAIEKKPELAEYLKTLEKDFQKGSAPGSEEPIHKNIIKEIEDLFKDNPGQN
jgi:proteasome assembly chaperone (PAC2) family protein